MSTMSTILTFYYMVYFRGISAKPKFNTADIVHIYLYVHSYTKKGYAYAHALSLYYTFHKYNTLFWFKFSRFFLFGTYSWVQKQIYRAVKLNYKFVATNDEHLYLLLTEEEAFP